MVLTRYLETPTINAIKSDIFKLDAAIIGNPEPEFFAGFKNPLPEGDVNTLIVMPPRTMVRMLLDVIAYADAEQTSLLPERWEIEHIFPQKWDSNFFTLNADETNDFLEHIGNKLPFEKQLNIKASNGYFDKKKEHYASSQIAVTKAFGACNRNNWKPTDIAQRDILLSNQLTTLFAKWVEDYKPNTDKKAKPLPTPEQAEMLRKLREAGIIP